MKPFRFVDLFCGGGGSITGAIDALKSAGMKYEGRGFNHWDLAIRTIQLNHPEIVPDFERACADVAEISAAPWSVYDNDPTRLDLLWASPSCTHHSRAAGRTPKSNQLRSQPEHLLPFLRLTKCRRMFVENVPELLEWGPVLDQDITYKGKRYKAGQADPRKKGIFFNGWLREVKNSGYHVDMAILNAADYGAATSRKRLIIQAVRKSSGEKIIWAEPTHAKDPGLFNYKPWRSASEIIDWSIEGKSIFGRKKPLCENTLRRIEAGIRKYWGELAEPFLIVLRGTSDDALKNTAVPLTAPLPTITAGGQHLSLIQPIWLDLAHTKSAGVDGVIDSPLNTITCTHGTHAVIQPFISRYNGGEDRNHEIDAPLPVIDRSNRYGVISPLIVPQQSAGTLKPSDDTPIPTVATSGAIGMVSPIVMDMSHPGDIRDAARCRSSEPIGTITTRNNWGAVLPFMMEYYGNGSSRAVTDPVPVILTRDHFGFVQGQILTLPDGKTYKLDITHRMLTAKELARATGFPEWYRFAGDDTSAKKMIGNAVCPDLAKALYLAVLAA